jgi:hypothetical protein
VSVFTEMKEEIVVLQLPTAAALRKMSLSSENGEIENAEWQFQIRGQANHDKNHVVSVKPKSSTKNRVSRVI